MPAQQEQSLTARTIQKTLDWAYDKAIYGIPGLGTAEDLANDYLKADGDLDKKVNSLIRWQNTKSATAGFATGVGGLFTLPVAIPADIASTIYIQIKMVAAIAIMYGIDVRDDKVRTLVYLCLVSSTTKDLLSQFGLKAGGRVFMQSLRKIPASVITKINQRVGIRLLTRFGRRGVFRLGRLAPFVGGFINATFDFLSTRAIARVAKRTFKELSANS